MYWCNKCLKHYDDDGFTVLKIEKEKTGQYRPYRDTLEWEPYTYTEVTMKCNVCGEIIKTEKDEVYHLAESRMQKYGYRHSHYDT